MTITTYQMLTWRRSRTDDFEHFEPVLPRELGAGDLRRGAPPAGADLPRHRRPAGTPPAGSDRDARARGRQGGRGLLPDRSRSATTCRGRCSRPRASSPPRPASRCACPSRTSLRSAYLSAVRARQVPRGLGEPGQDRRRDRAARWSVTRGGRILVIGQYINQLNALSRHAGRAADHRQDAQRRIGEKLYGAFRSGEQRRPDRVQGGQLRRRPAGGQRGDPDLGHLRLAPGGSPAPRSDPASEVRRRTRPSSTRW